MMTAEQKEQIDAAREYVRGVIDVLELHELRLDKFKDVKTDPSDPYSIEVSDAVDGLYTARDYLQDTLALLAALSN